MDLSGSMQAAGGVGGLLSIHEASGNGSAKAGQTLYPTYDGNGNITRILDSSSNVVCSYGYDPFGNFENPTGNDVDSSGYAAEQPFGFSTKYRDAETGLYYYGYRYYDPVTGRWPSRDPIAERGGMNLYGMVMNDSINWVDYLGLTKPGDVQWPDKPPPGSSQKVWDEFNNKFNKIFYKTITPIISDPTRKQKGKDPKPKKGQLTIIIDPKWPRVTRKGTGIKGAGGAAAQAADAIAKLLDDIQAGFQTKDGGRYCGPLVLELKARNPEERCFCCTISLRWTANHGRAAWVMPRLWTVSASSGRCGEKSSRTIAKARTEYGTPLYEKYKHRLQYNHTTLHGDPVYTIHKESGQYKIESSHIDMFVP